jgi:hypothetical protein
VESRVSISTFSELKSAIADFLNRDDLTAVVPTFVSLAEAQINRDIRHIEMENRATSTVSTQYLVRPSDWVETIRLQVTSGGTRNLQLLSKAAMADKRQGAENATGEPKYYCHSENTYEFFPTPDGLYTIESLYYQKIPALSDANTSNWLLASHPDVYLYGSLLHSAPYLAEDQRVGVWAQLYSAATQRVNQSSDDAQWSGTGLTMKIRGLG